MHRSIRSMSMSVRDQRDALGVMDNRFCMVVFFAGKMRHNDEASRPGKKDRGQSRHRQTRSSQGIHSSNIVVR